MRAPSAALLVCLLLSLPPLVAGCLGNSGTEDAATPTPGPDPTRMEGDRFTASVHLGRGALSTVTPVSADGTDLKIMLPEAIFLLEGDRVVTAKEATLKSGQPLRFLVPHTLDTAEMRVTVGTTTESHILEFPITDASWQDRYAGARGDGLDPLVKSGPNATEAWNATSAYPILSGDDVIALTRFAGQVYPDRAAGEPNYIAFQQWAKGYFEALGLRAVVDPFGTNGLPNGQGTPFLGARPNSAANVCGFKEGAGHPNEWIVFGGHYDIVPATLEGAYDDTVGTMIAFHLAKAFSKLQTDRTLVFCGWGGEENGLVGSMAFAKSVPPTARVIQYHNFDMAGLNWPMVPDPASPTPLTVSGNDAYKERMIAYAEKWLRRVLEYPPEGVRTGSYVAGGSDHISFASSGIPAYTYSAMGGGAYPHYHEPEDTVENLTAVAVGKRTVDELEPGEGARGEYGLARGLETVMWSAFYIALGADLGEFTALPCGPAC